MLIIFIEVMVILTVLFFLVCARIVKENDYCVIERFGKFHDVWLSGLHFLIPGIDTVRVSGDLKADAPQLWPDTATKLNFACGSDAHVHAEFNYTISKAGMTKEGVKMAVKKFTYFHDTPRERLAEVVAAYARPVLQSLTLEQANTEGADSSKIITPNVRRELEDYGVYPRDNAIIITSIDIPPDIQALKDIKAKSAQEAARTGTETDAHVSAIRALMKLDPSMTYEKALKQYNAFLAAKVATDSGAKFTFVASNLKSAIAMINPGGKDGNH